MRVFEDLADYMKGYHTIAYYTCEYDSIFEVVLFKWLAFIINMVLFVGVIIISVTCPVWCIPWLIYRLVKGRR